MIKFRPKYVYTFSEKTIKVPYDVAKLYVILIIAFSAKFVLQYRYCHATICVSIQQGIA
jgi:hypothetical protein